ncbi:YceI family protein [Lentzea sp. NBRC 102530]|uniref:YceI family protein n=1 Tax=Lentzea sp. NBRC 102530 TaxID=3032201 RepID=UPI0024A42344|nr:YceI family protein [Lentzea sp. NBRC 102530]GLY47383.1 hypothetical protein Lesp01_10390 [Lentzea sp. NBRC 102530]
MTTVHALAPGRWQADLTRTTASFTVGNLGRRTRGTVPVTAGSVEIGADGALLGVRGTLDLSGIATGVPKRDLDLRRPGLLDLDRHPTMRFTATSARTTADGWEVTGTLTCRGTAAEITGVVTVDDLVLTATARLDRRALGIRAPSFLIGRWVDITVTAAIRHSA